MISSGLVQDQTGNIYSLETNHNGYYGMLRYQSGAYDGLYLDLESSHGGSFAKIKNQDGIDGLKGIYGLTQVNIDNSNCVYTSSFNHESSGSKNRESNYIEDNTENGYSDQLKEWIKDADWSTYDNEMGDTASGEEWNWH